MTAADKPRLQVHIDQFCCDAVSAADTYASKRGDHGATFLAMPFVNRGVMRQLLRSAQGDFETDILQSASPSLDVKARLFDRRSASGRPSSEPMIVLIDVVRHSTL